MKNAVWKQRRHLARVERQKRNRGRRLMADHSAMVAPPTPADEEKAARKVLRLFSKPASAIFTGLNERRIKRRYELQKRI